MTRGLPRLCKWLTELQQKVHGLGEPTEWAVDMGSGSQDCMHVFFASVLNDGDYVLLDAPSYPVRHFHFVPLLHLTDRSLRAGHIGHAQRVQPQLCGSGQ